MEVLFFLDRLSFARLQTCELQCVRHWRCRYPRHVGDTSERTLCHCVTVAVQYLPAKELAVEGRESDGNAALDAVDRRVRHRSQCWEVERANGELFHCRQAGTPRVRGDLTCTHTAPNDKRDMLR
jgi:hypothetical protein